MSILRRRYWTLTLLALVLLGCRRNASVIDNISQQLRNGATQVDLRHSGDFPWDELFVFGPYAPTGEICRTLKLNASQCSAAGVKDVDEGEFLLVFMHGGAVSKMLSFPRIADFDESEKCLGKAIRKDLAVFTVQRKADRVYLVCRQ